MWATLDDGATHCPVHGQTFRAPSTCLGCADGPAAADVADEPGPFEVVCEQAREARLPDRIEAERRLWALAETLRRHGRFAVTRAKLLLDGDSPVEETSIKWMTAGVNAFGHAARLARGAISMIEDRERRAEVERQTRKIEPVIAARRRRH